MKRHELEHLIRAAGAITGADEIVVIGSQAILAVSKLVAGREKDRDFIWDDAPAWHAGRRPCAEAD